MPSLNQTTIVGHLTRDPELRYATSGMAICKFGLATSQRTGRGENAKEVSHFFDITCFRDVAEEVGAQLRKGSAAAVIGTLQYETWEDKQTKQKRSKVSIIANIVAIPLYQKKDAAPASRQPEAEKEEVAATQPESESQDIPF